MPTQLQPTKIGDLENLVPSLKKRIVELAPTGAESYGYVDIDFGGKVLATWATGLDSLEKLTVLWPNNDDFGRLNDNHVRLHYRCPNAAVNVAVFAQVE